MLPLFWGIDELGGEDGKEARRWLVGTEAERDLAGKDKEGLALVGVRLTRDTQIRRHGEWRRTKPLLMTYLRTVRLGPVLQRRRSASSFHQGSP
jgi:hypothetical protein